MGQAQAGADGAPQELLGAHSLRGWRFVERGPRLGELPSSAPPSSDKRVAF